MLMVCEKLNTKTMPKYEGDYAICHSNQYTLKMKRDIYQ